MKESNEEQFALNIIMNNRLPQKAYMKLSDFKREMLDYKYSIKEIDAIIERLQQKKMAKVKDNFIGVTPDWFDAYMRN